MHMKPKGENITDRVKEAREQLDEVDLELNQDDIDLWFSAYPYPSPTLFALDFDIDPARLKQAVESNDLVRRAMYRIIAQAEARLYTQVYGPKAVIQRVELFLPVQTVLDTDFDNVFADSSTA